MTSVRTVRGKSYGAQPESTARDIAEHVTLRIPQELVQRVRQRMRLRRMSRTQVLLEALERGMR